MSATVHVGSGPQAPDSGQLVMQAAYTSPNIYANGYANTSNGIDLTTALLWNSKPAAMLSMSLPAAKSFATAILTLIQDVERRSGLTVLSMDDVLAKVGLGEPGASS